MKITHVYPQAGVPTTGEWDRTTTPPVWVDTTQTFIGNGDTEADVWEEMRFTTLRDYLNKVVVIETHQFAFEDVREQMNKDAYDPSNVFEFGYTDSEKTIRTPAGEKKIKARRFAHLGDVWQVEGIVEKAKDANVLVVYEPYVEAGDLDCLPELQKRCPHLHVVIFHQVCDKIGVVVEGDVDPENWEDEFPVMGECDLPSPEVIVDDPDLPPAFVHVRIRQVSVTPSLV
jgi:hypothetical protein